MAVKVNDTVIGDGVVKICVPIVGRNEKEILLQCRNAKAAGPDMLEWRADYFDGLKHTLKVLDMLDKIQDQIGEIPLIFTVRTKEEGGEAEIKGADYRKLVMEVIRNGRVKLVDVEIYKPDVDTGALIREIKAEGGYCIASNHHFNETPTKEAMKQILDDMEEKGADILKLAVMPKSKEDVCSLMMVTLQKSKTTTCPVITMSMGKLGQISRISGAFFGSSLTFATVGESSAPGQIPVAELKNLLRYI